MENLSGPNPVSLDSGKEETRPTRQGFFGGSTRSSINLQTGAGRLKLGQVKRALRQIRSGSVDSQ